ncbi:hypothetical protein [Phytohabitans aurantiacus]|uniref:DUF3093 domain-containing protein n=1 Tax=Phytohabitans aurantiacus TaxID=3016789 RepID=A0ABQ5QY14_9ACTN|nr:hypothetical protein [Phytohabitans aurantiacus]GLH98821.1 hypothetical protein Pa4123_40960 [Phytohabitans aurantiacus]
MTFTWTGRDDRRWAWIGIGIFAGTVVAGALPAATIGGPLWAWAVFVWCLGLCALVAGAVMFIGSLRTVHIYLDESVVDIRIGNLVLTTGWEHVAAINVEQVPEASRPQPQELLVLWLTDDSLVKARPRYPATGEPKGHVLADLANLEHSRAEITEALRRYAGDRFRSAITA